MERILLLMAVSCEPRPLELPVNFYWSRRKRHALTNHKRMGTRQSGATSLSAIMDQPFPVHSFSEKEEFEEALCQWVLERAEKIIHKKGCFNVAVGGGSLIKAMASMLHGADLENWRVFMLDERLVPEDNPDSNYGAWKQAIPNLAFIPVDTALPVEEAAEAYSKVLPTKGLDMAVIGMGPDGHIASLFPGLFNPDDTHMCIPVTDSPKPPPTRVSLSICYLLKCRELVFAVSGAEKQSGVERTWAGDLSLPAAHLNLSKSVWFVKF